VVSWSEHLSQSWSAYLSSADLYIVDVVAHDACLIK